MTKQTRRSILKKVALSGIVGGTIVGSSGTAAAANSTYKVIVEHDGSGDGDYSFTVDDGGDGDAGVRALNGTMESTDGWYSESDGSITVYGSVSSSDQYDKYEASDVGALTVNNSTNCTVYKSQ